MYLQILSKVLIFLPPLPPQKKQKKNTVPCAPTGKNVVPERFRSVCGIQAQLLASARQEALNQQGLSSEAWTVRWEEETTTSWKI